MTRGARVLLTLLIFSVRTLFASAEGPDVVSFSMDNIISPSAGEWCNLQPLVIKDSEKYRIRYSVNGSDYTDYSVPVLLNRRGSVSIGLIVEDFSGKTSSFTVNYSVKANNQRLSSVESNFISSIENNPVVEYFSGDRISIPVSMFYCFSHASLRGRDVFLSERNCLERYVPCRVWKSENEEWRFVIHVRPQKKNICAPVQKDTPFSVRNFTEIQGNDDSYIYQFDDEYWCGANEVHELDSSAVHKVKWQSIEYVPGNEVLEFLLPACPSLKVDAGNGRTVVSAAGAENNIFYIDGCREFVAEAFEGENLAESFLLKISCADSDGEFYLKDSGSVLTNIYADREPPSAPLIKSSTGKSVSRNRVLVDIFSGPASKKHDDIKLFYSVEKICKKNDSKLVHENVQKKNSGFYYDEDFGEEYIENYLEPDKEKDFHLYDGKALEFSSEQVSETEYMVRAYAEDSDGNVSDVSEYKVLVAPENYYLKTYAEGEKSSCDGSYANPFASFDQAVKVLNRNGGGRLFVLSDVNVRGNLNFRSDCEIYGDNIKINFARNASLKVYNSAVKVKACFLMKNNSSGAEKEFIKLYNGTFTAESCILFADFAEEGILVSAYGSAVRISDCDLTVSGSAYSSVLDSRKSDVFLENCRVSSSASSSVSFCVSEGTFSLLNSFASVSGNFICSGQFSGCQLVLIGNEFSGNFYGEKKKIEPVWKDSETEIISDSGNEIKGYE